MDQVVRMVHQYLLVQDSQEALVDLVVQLDPEDLVALADQVAHKVLGVLEDHLFLTPLASLVNQRVLEGLMDQEDQGD